MRKKLSKLSSRRKKIGTRINRQSELGLTRLDRLNRKTAQDRVKELLENIENNKYKDPETLGVAKRWVYWYRCFAKKRNGGATGSRRSSASAA